MMDEILYPGLVWVKDPINLTTGVPSGEAPRRRHHEKCGHFFVDDRGTLLGPAPYRASEEQMRVLPPCKTCVGSDDSHGDAPSSSTSAQGGGDVARAVCAECGMEKTTSGACFC